MPPLPHAHVAPAAPGASPPLAPPCVPQCADAAAARRPSMPGGATRPSASPPASATQSRAVHAGASAVSPQLAPVEPAALPVAPLLHLEPPATVIEAIRAPGPPCMPSSSAPVELGPVVLGPPRRAAPAPTAAPRCPTAPRAATRTVQFADARAGGAQRETHASWAISQPARPSSSAAGAPSAAPTSAPAAPSPPASPSPSPMPLPGVLGGPWRALVVNCRDAVPHGAAPPVFGGRARSSRAPLNDPCVWGNYAYTGLVRSASDRDAAISAFRASLQSTPETVLRARRELKGKRLACYCAPLNCHLHVLAEAANCSLAQLAAWFPRAAALLEPKRQPRGASLSPPRPRGGRAGATRQPTPRRLRR